MADSKFDPMQEIANLRQTVSKAIDQGIQSVQSMTGQQSMPFKVDIYELDQQLVIRTSAIDNLIASSIEVSMEDNLLTISGESKPDDIPALAAVIMQERRFGKFARIIQIDIPVDSNQAKAKLKNNSLTVTLPIIVPTE